MKISYLLYNKKIVFIVLILAAIILYLCLKPTVREYEIYSIGVPILKKEFILIVPEERNFAILEKEYEYLKTLEQDFLDYKELSLLCDKKLFCELYHYLKEKNLDKVSFFLYVDRFI